MTLNTTGHHLRRPTEDEYGEYFAGYVAKVRGENILEQLESQIVEMEELFESIPDNQASEIHPPFIWTIKQVVGHLIDGEKIFGYRLHRFACTDAQELPGFDHHQYVDNLDYENVTLAQLASELVAVRRANSCFLQRLLPSAWDLAGVASETRFTVRALAYITVGHINHHLAIIRQRMEG